MSITKHHRSVRTAVRTACFAAAVLAVPAVGGVSHAQEPDVSVEQSENGVEIRVGGSTGGSAPAAGSAGGGASVAPAGGVAAGGGGTAAGSAADPLLLLAAGGVAAVAGGSFLIAKRSHA